MKHKMPWENFRTVALWTTEVCELDERNEERKAHTEEKKHISRFLCSKRGWNWLARIIKTTTMRRSLFWNLPIECDKTKWRCSHRRHPEGGGKQRNAENGREKLCNQTNCEYFSCFCCWPVSTELTNECHQSVNQSAGQAAQGIWEGMYR